jgi:phenylacetate-CoA ligase
MGNNDTVRSGTLLFRLATALRGEKGISEYVRALQRAEQRSPAELRAMQQRRLAAMMNHACETVPWYRAHGLAPVRDPAHAFVQLAGWPLLEKAVLQSSPDDLRSSQRYRTTMKSTGGSTGAPVRLWKDADGLARERAVTWRALEWHGVVPGDRCVRVWGTPLTARRRITYWLADAAMNRTRISAFEMQESDYARHLAVLQRIRPTWIYGYSTAIHSFAEWADANGHDLRSLRVRLIVLTAEPSTRAMRQLISRVFDCPVQNEYGAGEIGAFAYSCPHDQLHIFVENVFVEVLDDEGCPVPAGEMGEIVVTDLTNRAMPLLRYRLGDRVRLGEPCACGLPLPTISEVGGRTRDLIVTPRGRKVYGGQIHYHISGIGGRVPGFHQYQFVQTAADRAEVRVVGTRDALARARPLIETFGRTHLDGMTLDVVAVDRIERERSGKLRLVKYELAEAAQTSRGTHAQG